MLCLLGAMLQDKYEIKIVDAQFYNMSEEQFKKGVERFQPDCVGISGFSLRNMLLFLTQQQLLLKVLIKHNNVAGRCACYDPILSRLGE